MTSTTLRVIAIAMIRRLLALIALAVLSPSVGCAIHPLSSSSGEPSGPSRTTATALAALARAFPGRVGLAVEDVQSGWTAAYDGRALYPQQSAAKLCTALAFLDAVDRRQVRLNDPVLVGRQDMSVFHQPIQAHLIGDAPYATTVGDLLTGAIVESDNAADDILIRRVGGPAVVQRAVDARGLRAIRCGPQEHLLESEIAGLTWRPEYSFGRTFWDARDRVGPQVRRTRLNAYLANPPDGASPLALVHMLARLQRGELLSPTSTAWLLDAMARTRTGPQRLPAGLPPGWRIAHKTGTGQDLGDLATGNNDVGLLTAPDGHVYAVAVMIASTRRPVPDRQKLDADVARAVVAAHDMSFSLDGRRKGPAP